MIEHRKVIQITKATHITKATQILKILYPENIQTEQFEYVAKTIVPMIEHLVDLAEPVCEMPVPVFETDKTATKIPIKPIKMADKLIIPHEPKTLPSKYPTFKECDKHHIDSTWHETKFGQAKYIKNNGNIVFQADSCRIDTTWDALNVFYNLLPDETVIMDLPSLSIKKARTLINFFTDHPKFNCHLEKRSGGNVLIKDTITLRQDTQRKDDTGTVDADMYGSEE